MMVGWVEQHKCTREVQIIDQTTVTCMVAVQGPRALELCRGLTETDAGGLGYYHATPTRFRGKGCVVSRTGYTGEDGMEIMVGAAQAVELWEELVGRSALPCGLGARDTLRLGAGMSLYGQQPTEGADHVHVRLARAAKRGEGDLTGRSALARG